MKSQFNFLTLSVLILTLNYLIMKKNMGSTDRVIRLLLAVILAALAYFGVLTGTAATVLYVVAAVFALTSFISFCPIYTLLGINTCKIK